MRKIEGKLREQSGERKQMTLKRQEESHKHNVRERERERDGVRAME